jgi:hypothetical protein
LSVFCFSFSMGRLYTLRFSVNCFGATGVLSKDIFAALSVRKK